MKAKKNAREIRADGERKRREWWAAEQAPAEEAKAPRPAAPVPPVPMAPKLTPAQRAELEAAEAREFLDYLEREHRVVKDEDAPRPAPVRRELVGTLNLETGMPTVEEAVGRLRIGLQEMRGRGVCLVRLIHGYGSTGRGGALRMGIRAELARMKKRRLIRDFVAGEDFGPFHEAARALVDRCPALARDPDYGRCNQGITVVAL